MYGGVATRTRFHWATPLLDEKRKNEMITQFVYIDNKTKRESLQILKDKKSVMPVNLYLHKNGNILYFELIEQEEERKFTNQLIEKIDEDGNTYFDFIK